MNPMEKPLVSVIIPTYNRGDIVMEAIDSVIQQTYRPLEILVIDDGSMDNTFRIIRNRFLILKSNLTIRYFYQSNKGVSSARNLGIMQSHGEYIAFLDSDDLWDKQKLEIQMNFLSPHKDFMVCYTDEIWIRKGVRVNAKNIHRKYSGYIYEYCLPLCIISASSILLKRDVIDDIGLFDESLSACEDYDYWLRLCSEYPIYFVNQKLITKRAGHSDQLSYKYPVMDRFRIFALLKILSDNHLKQDQYHKTVQILLKKCHIVKNGAHKRNNKDDVKYYSSIIRQYEGNLSG